MIIREANINDALSIARVTVDTWKTAYRGMINDHYLDNLSYEDREKSWRQFPFHNAFIYVAEDEDQNIIGFAAAGPERTANPAYRGELYAIYIYQQYQNQGIGSALFHSVVRKFQQTGIDSLMLWVLSGSPYRRFYERLGGHPLESKLLEIDGLANQITAYGWPEIHDML